MRLLRVWICFLYISDDIFFCICLYFFRTLFCEWQFRLLLSDSARLRLSSVCGFFCVFMYFLYFLRPFSASGSFIFCSPLWICFLYLCIFSIFLGPSLRVVVLSFALRWCTRAPPPCVALQRPSLRRSKLVSWRMARRLGRWQIW